MACIFEPATTKIGTRATADAQSVWQACIRKNWDECNARHAYCMLYRIWVRKTFQDIEFTPWIFQELASGRSIEKCTGSNESDPCDSFQLHGCVHYSRAWQLLLDWCEIKSTVIAQGYGNFFWTDARREEESHTDIAHADWFVSAFHRASCVAQEYGRCPRCAKGTFRGNPIALAVCAHFPLPAWLYAILAEPHTMPSLRPISFGTEYMIGYIILAVTRDAVAGNYPIQCRSQKTLKYRTLCRIRILLWMEYICLPLHFMWCWVRCVLFPLLKSTIDWHQNIAVCLGILPHDVSLYMPNALQQLWAYTCQMHSNKCAQMADQDSLIFSFLFVSYPHRVSACF